MKARSLRVLRTICLLVALAGLPASIPGAQTGGSTIPARKLNPVVVVNLTVPPAP